MQLPDEAIAFEYEHLLAPPALDWTPAAELRARHFLDPGQLRSLAPRVLQVRSQVAAEREVGDGPAESRPPDAAFIELPQKTLDDFRRKGESSTLGRIQARAARLGSQVDRLVILGAGGFSLGARALFQASRPAYHNELPAESRIGVPRVYFAGEDLDNDGVQDLLELLQTTCVDPELRSERWGMVVINPTGTWLETAAAYRFFRREATEYYGRGSASLRQYTVPVTRPTGSFRELCRAEGFTDEDLVVLPAEVSARFSIFTAAGLLPAAAMGLDVRALLLGAAAMTRRFLDEPFERNPVLQFAAVNFLAATEAGKPIRVLGAWSRKLETLGHWYDQLLAESLGKQGRGPTPLTAVLTRELYARGQQHLHGCRDKFINNLVVKSPRSSALPLGMADRNEDGLNALARKTLPQLLDAAFHTTGQACFEAARPTANLVIPSLTEHALGQLLQMLMLATVVEGRLMGVNPYGQPVAEAYSRRIRTALDGKAAAHEVPSPEKAGVLV